jgi:hypothetical protein
VEDDDDKEEEEVIDVDRPVQLLTQAAEIKDRLVGRGGRE